MQLRLFFIPAIAVLAQAESGRDRHFDFGRIFIDGSVQHTFTVRNDSERDLVVRDVSLTAPLTVTAMPGKLQPGESGNVTIIMDKQGRKYGEYDGFVAVKFTDEKVPPAQFIVTGTIVAPITFEPFAGFFLSTPKGVPKEAAIEIVNNESEPLRIIGVEHASSRFRTELETVEEGRRFRLKLLLDGTTPGRGAEKITIVTSSRQSPFLEVMANTLVKDRVFAFPDRLDIGAIDVSQLKARPNMVAYLGQGIIVSQLDGKDFQISAETDVPFLRLETKQAQLKDRAEVKIAIIPEKLKEGNVEGTITVSTNDPEIPKLTIPVTAAINGSW